jgi:MscS family membrane protein
MANETLNQTANATPQDLSILEPYVDKALIEQLMSMDPLMVSVVLLAVSVVLAIVVLAILKIITGQVAKRTTTEVDDKLLAALQKPVFRLLVLGGFYLAILNLGLDAWFADVALKLIVTLAYLFITMFAVNALDIITNIGIKDLVKKTESTLDDEIIPIVHKTVKVVIWAFGLMLILGAWGIDVGPFLAGLGIAGLAISFALQSTLANVFAGVSLILDKTFKVGDKVQLESGELGVIHDLSLRSTRLRTYDNELVIIPNDQLAKGRIKNYTQPDSRIRVVVPFSVEYGNKPEKVIPVIEKAIKANIKDMLDDPPMDVIFTSMGDSSINFQVRFWLAKYGEAYAKKLEANDLIYKTLNKNKIGIPFPTQTIHLKK